MLDSLPVSLAAAYELARQRESQIEHLTQAELGVNIIGSSIAMLSGQKPPFRLLVRAIDSETGLRVDRVQWAVSDAFVVATQRVKGAQKAEIPHIEEHVSKIENVGVQVSLLAIHHHVRVAFFLKPLLSQAFDPHL